MKSLNREEQFESTSREYLESKQCFLEKGAIMQLVCGAYAAIRSPLTLIWLCNGVPQIPVAA